MEPANEHDLDGDLPRDSYFESGQEYTIRENGVLHIPKGSTLLIQPGALVKFGSGAKMVVEGELIACGTKSRRILFTADTRNGTPGFWKGIEFIRADDRSVLGHATFEYAGNSYHPVIQLDGTNLRIEDLKFDANKYYSLSLSPDSFPELRQPYNVDNGPSGWEIRGGTLDDDLTWDASQPLVIQGTLAIAQGRTLTVNAGTHVKFLPNAQIQVYGKIRALGTASQHIQVTAAASELAEPGQSPSNDPWSGLVFKGTDSSAEMVYVDYQYEEQEENP